MAAKEAQARIKINKLLEKTGWRFFDHAEGKANVVLKSKVKLTKADIDGLGENFEQASNGFIDSLLLNEADFPLVVLEAKSEDKNPLVGNASTQKFVEVYLNSISIEGFVTGAVQPKLNQQALNSIQIPIPDDVAVPSDIVAGIEAEQALVATNRELIARFEAKIKATINRVWGDAIPELLGETA